MYALSRYLVYNSAVEINTSITNFLDTKIPYTVLWTAEKLVMVAKDCGYSRVEWHPIPTFSGTQMKAGFISDKTKNAIASIHQNTPKQETLSAAWNHPNRFLAILHYVFLQNNRQSLDSLEYVQKVIDKKVPMILYPPIKRGESGTNRDFIEKLFQPTSDIMHMWKVKTVKQLIAQSKRRGYTGFCLDTFHMRKKAVDGIDLNPWETNLKSLLTFTKEIHLAIGRGDIIQSDINSQRELVDLINNNRKSEIFQILRSIKSFGWQGEIVLEAPAKALFAIAPHKKPTVDLLIKYHKTIVRNLSSFFS